MLRNTYIRDYGSFSGNLLGMQLLGSIGKIISGPVDNFDSYELLKKRVSELNASKNGPFDVLLIIPGKFDNFVFLREIENNIKNKHSIMERNIFFW